MLPPYASTLSDVESLRELARGWRAVAVLAQNKLKWQPIDQAPKDGTRLELWVVYPQADLPWSMPVFGYFDSRNFWVKDSRNFWVKDCLTRISGTITHFRYPSTGPT